MKTFTIIIFFLFAMLQTQAQDYLISFAGTGMSSSVNTVKVENLTQGISLTMNGTDVLTLMSVLGINPVDPTSDNTMCIYPNPMTERSFVEFDATAAGMTSIELCDMSGKQVIQTQRMLPAGRHTFSISGLSSGVYTLKIKSAAYYYTGKLVFNGTGSGFWKISYVSNNLKPAPQSNLKTTKSLVPMQYNNGDQLLFTGFSGIYSTVFPLVPTQSQTVTFNFVACTDADGNNYTTVTIGTQVWMAQNLNVGTRINGSQEQTNNGIIEKYCYNDLESNCDVYGGLYQWDEAMQYVTTEGTKGICPTGWHLPMDDEWTTLTEYLGGLLVAGGKMKEAGLAHWTSPNTEATNSSGFTALPGGYRNANSYFYEFASFSYFWSSSQYDATHSWNRGLGYDDEMEYRSNGTYKTFGFSCRCLKD